MNSPSRSETMRTRTLDRLGLMSIASALALSIAVLPSTAAWSENNGQPQWQQHNQTHQAAPNKGGQAQNRQFIQPRNAQPQNNRQFTQQRNSQPQYNRQFTQQKNNQVNPQWQPRVNGQSYGQNYGKTNGQYVQQHNNSQWKPGNGQYVQQHNNRQPQYNRQFTQQTNNQQHTQWNQHRYNWSDYRPGHQPPQWNQHRNDVNIHAYNWNRTSAVRYHYRPYEPPHGYYYRRWAYGQVLPTVYWSQNYWLTDYYSFGLVNPPYGYVWVRYGPDALLINVYNGQILSVEYNVFYA
jgi:Ni/Co efflux regulator RcnB